MRNGKIVHKKHISTRGNPTAAGSAIGSDTLENVPGRKRKPPPKYENFETAQLPANSHNRETPKSASFFNNERAPILQSRTVNNFDKVLPSSQPLSETPPTQDQDIRTPDSPISSVSPLSNPDVDHSKTAGRGTIDYNGVESNNISASSTMTDTSSQQQNNTVEEPIHDKNCPICREDVTTDQNGLLCEMCWTWSHSSCLFIPDEEYRIMEDDPDPWFCVTCQSIKANKIKWGELEGEANIKAKMVAIYDEITKWRKNLFMVPRGKVGTDFIKEVTRILRQFTIPSKWSRIALTQLHIFIPLMLQKPSKKSKAKDHAKYLEKRLKLWSLGDLDAILRENRQIQKRLK